MCTDVRVAVCQPFVKRIYDDDDLLETGGNVFVHVILHVCHHNHHCHHHQIFDEVVCEKRHIP